MDANGTKDPKPPSTDVAEKTSELPETRARSESTWTTRSTIMSTQRPIYHTRTVRDQYLKPVEVTPIKEKLIRKVKDCGRCNKTKVKKCTMGVFPFLRVMRRYNWKTDLPSDVIAGLTVGIMQLPQGMAYSMLADLPPVVGLYVSFFPVIIYYFFGTSKQVSMGTVAVVSLMVGSVVASQATQWRKEQGLGVGKEVNMTQTMKEAEISFKIGIGASVAFITGLVQIGMGVCRVGFVTTYMGDPLVSGFTTGAAAHVFTSQVKNIFGISIARYPNLMNLIYNYIAMFKELPNTNIATLVLSVVCMIFLYVVKVYVNDKFKAKLKMPIPVELIVVVVSTLVCHYGEFKKRWGVKVVGRIPAGLPEPSFPTFVNIGEYGVDCIIIAVVAFAQSVSLAVIMAKKHHYDIDSNKELIGYGAGTLFGSFFGCYPMAASVSRSSVQDSAGGKSQLASLVSALLVLIVILFIGPLFENLPNCALSAIIIIALKSMFMQVLEVKTLFKTSKMDCLIWLVTFGCVIILNVDMGLVAGIGFACCTVVIRSQMAKVTTLEKLKELDEYRPISLYSKTDPHPSIRVVSYNSPLYFANSELFLSHIHRETTVKPERMRKALKKLMTANESENSKKKLPDSSIVEMETVTPQPLSELSNGDSHPSNADMLDGTRVSVIGPAPSLDPRPFLYLIIDCTAFTFIDPVGIKVLKQLIEDYKTVGITTYLGGVGDDVWYTMEQSGFTTKYERIIFLTVRDAVLAAEEDKHKRSHPIPGYTISEKL
ncbi:prestin-like isoform X2 [Physella acuta]|uniref:prestin-like isoform X2 n=1 Tax=Physella acuta TaxID=109671 RepID=UPI0027DD3D9C|nr:prestin-like isoform X2 [Physella acuta]